MLQVTSNAMDKSKGCPLLNERLTKEAKRCECALLVSGRTNLGLRNCVVAQPLHVIKAGFRSTVLS